MFVKHARNAFIALICCLSISLVTGCAEKKVSIPETTTQGAVSGNETVNGRVVNRANEPNANIEDLGEEGVKSTETEQQQKLKEEIEEFESSSIYFDFDKSDLTPEARKNLEKKAEWLLNHPSYSVRIEGNCDERGSTEYNLALGQRRANAAARYLEALGVSPDRIKTISYGEENPVDPRHNEEAWAKNRRDDFRLIR